MPRNPKVDFDLLQMYFGKPYVIDVEDAIGQITIYSPSIGDMINIGETKFYQTLNIFTCNTTQYRLMLWQMNVDWNELSDFELFTFLYKSIDADVCKLIFRELDFQKFERMYKVTDDNSEGELILWNERSQVEINKNVHNHISQYLRTMFNIFPDEKITHSQFLKEQYIAKDKRAEQRAAEKAEKGESKTFSIQPIISACVNHPGFKYKLSELEDVGAMEFYDSVSRIQIYEQTTSLMKGMYSGFIDSKGINPETYNFMREIVRDANNSVSKKLKDNG